jgi:hypothetical protein
MTGSDHHSERTWSFEILCTPHYLKTRRIDVAGSPIAEFLLANKPGQENVMFQDGARYRITGPLPIVSIEIRTFGLDELTRWGLLIQILHSKILKI